MARMVYGDGYGDVANRELAMDAARDSRYFNSMASNRAAQAQAMQQAQANASNQLSWQQLLQQAAENRLRNDMNNRRFDFDVAATREQLGLSRDRAMAEQQQQADVLGLRRRQLDFETSPQALADSQGDADYGEAVSAVGAGYFDRPGADIASLFPTLSSNRLARVNAFVDARRSGVSERDEAAANQAKLLNDQLLAMRRAAASSQVPLDLATSTKGINLPRWMGGAGLDSTLEDEAKNRLLGITSGASDETLPMVPSSDLQKFLASVAKNPRIGSVVSFDEGTQTFAPLRPAAQVRPAPAARGPVIDVQATYPVAPSDPAARERDKTYTTPRGPLRWTGTGWVAP